MSKKEIVSLACLVLLYLAFRLPNLLLIPVFADEAIYIHWSQIIWHDASNRFIPLSDGKTPLFMWLLIPLLKVIADPLLAGRLLSVISGLATLIGVYMLGKKLFSHNVGLIAGLLVVLQPFVLFYDRMAVVDSMLTAFAVWSFYALLRLIDEPTIGKGIILGTLWGGAVLTKPAGSYLILFTPFILLLSPLEHGKKKAVSGFLMNIWLWLKGIKKLMLPLVLAGGYALGFYNILRLSPAYPMIRSRSLDYLRPIPELMKNPVQFFPNTARVMLEWLASYISWVGILLIFFFIMLVLYKEIIQVKKKVKDDDRENSYLLGISGTTFKILILFLFAVLAFCGQAATAYIIYPRYMLFIVPFLLIILAWGFEYLWQLRRTYQKIITSLIASFVILSWLNFDFWLLTNPANAPLHKAERTQYLEEWSAGYGIKEAAEVLKSKAQNGQVTVGTEGRFGTLPDGLQIYLDKVNGIDVITLEQPVTAVDSRLKLSASRGIETFMLVNSSRLQTQDNRLELVAKYPKPKGEREQENLLFFRIKTE